MWNINVVYPVFFNVKIYLAEHLLIQCCKSEMIGFFASPPSPIVTIFVESPTFQMLK